MSISEPHIVLAGGGSCGHLFPGLAVAEELARRWPMAQISFAGTGRAFERQYAHAAGFEYRALPSHPSPRKAWQTLRFMTDNFAGYVASRWMLREHKVSLVVGLGGYASVPVVRAAQAASIPTVLLEQNAVPGRATRWLASAASLVCAAYLEAAQHLPPETRLCVTGNPIRPGFRPRTNDRSGSAKRQLLVTAGTSGAEALNVAMPKAAAMLAPLLHDWQIVHQTGGGSVEVTQQRYDVARADALAVSFVENLSELLRTTDLVISRAGGSTLSELAIVGAPSIVVPWPGAADDHQAHNARAVAENGACVLINEHRGASLEVQLARKLERLLESEPARAQLSQQMLTLAKPQAASDIVDAICELHSPHWLRSAA